ncbi:MAG: hypothetical protein GWO20_11465 [Candidatus Korarchaeota archaeon]|nr:hypothetical protein [Candidatus Korarchaeota archaeon]NIU83913.1 hypothetical protein [Candidatus Thorarchaeota archaeon]NIW14204.1 hypothetical protein [Candidatus Thorarchaeota archaeon]NIW52303.1 hypothetical protein [Candidatus Korarchaeota archaeon]
MIKERILKGLSVFKVSKRATLKFLSVTLMFILAFLLRAFPVIEHGYSIRAYDPYVQFYTAQYILDHGLKAFFSFFDTQSWVPWGRKLGTFYIGVGGLGALFHLILTFLGFDVPLITVVTLIPPLFGALSCLAIYGLIGDLSSDRAALFSSFIAAISLGMIRRSIAGFFDNDAVGVFFIIMSLWMFIRGMKRESFVYPFLSGIFLGLLGWTWGSSKYLFGLYGLFVFLLLIMGELDSNVGLNYAITILVAMGLMVILPANYESMTDTTFVLSYAIIALIFLDFAAIYLAEVFSLEKQKVLHRLVGGVLLLGIIGGIVLSFTGRLGRVGTKYLSILNPTIRDQLPAFSSVSENQPAPWSSVFQGIFLPIIFTPLGIYYFFEERSKEGGFFVLCMFTAFYFSSSISRLVVMFSPFFAMAAGIGIDYLLAPLATALKKEWIMHKVRPIRRRLGELTLPRGEAVAGYALVGLVLFLTVYHTRQNVEQMAGYDISGGERKIFQYLRTHASRSDVVAAWWDYGYRIRYSAHVTTIVDNFTNNNHQLGTVGAMLMLPPSKSVELLRKYRVKYVVAYQVDVRKAQWMIKISSKHAPEWGVQKDEWYDEETNKYLRPFFKSTLWRLVVAQMRGESQLVSQLGAKKLQEEASSFEVGSGDLKFFKAVETGKNVYLYKVLYRAPIESLTPS